MKKTALITILFLLTGSVWCLSLPDSSEPVLTDANLLTGFVRVDPDDKKPETLPTQAWLWQDGSDLVVRFAAQIDSSFTQGSISVKDEGTSADYLRVQLITIPDAYYAYYYVAFPRGNLLDGVRDENMNVDYAWNSHYSYESGFTADIWTVTMRIPLNELRFKQEQPYRWKIILGRYHYQSDEFHSLPYAVTNMDKEYFLKAQDIELSTPVRHKLDITFKPYFVKSYDLIAQTSSWDPEHIGLDVALNPGQRTRIKLSLNPDFSDIPMDSAQDDYNSKNPPYYDENRFFFTEDLDAFGVDWNYFYSRNIVQPRLAAKATGNTKTFNWGVLAALDKEIKDGDEVINPGAYYQVLALNPSWRKLQLANALISRMDKGQYGHLYSGGASWEMLPRFHLKAIWNLSIRKDAPGGVTVPQQGYKAGLGLGYKPGNFDLGVAYARLSKDLSYDAGYLYEKDYDYLAGSCGWNRSFAEKKVRYLSFSWWGNLYRLSLSEDPHGSYETGMVANLNTSSRFNFLAHLTAARNPDLAEVLHDTHSATLGCTWNKLRNFRIYGGYNYAKTIVYALGDTYPKHTINLNAWTNPLKNLTLSLVGSWNQYGYDQLLDPETGLVLLDDEYIIANATLEYTPAAVFKLTLGSGLSTYEQAGKSASLNYYGNLRYEFRPEWFAFIGIKSAQTQTEASTWNDPLGEFRQDLNTAYAKLSVAF